ncbi:MAG TPA: hypothetical protein VIG99_05930 [Myxococcaceae bacterium]
MRTSDEVFPALPKGLEMPFYYASLSSLWVYYRVELETARRHVAAAPGLELALFDGAPVAALNFQRYTSHGDSFLKTTTEVEFNLLAYPAAGVPSAPALPLGGWLAGDDATRTIGQLRLQVAADNEFAVWAGQELFGEPKFYTTFTYRVPSLNARDTTAWDIRINEPPADGAKPPDERFICRFTADLTGLPMRAVNGSPLAKWSVLRGRTVQTQWNLLGAWQGAQVPQDQQRRFSLSTGGSATRMAREVSELLGGAPPVAVHLFESQPAAAETRGFFIAPPPERSGP